MACDISVCPRWGVEGVESGLRYLSQSTQDGGGLEW